MIDIVQGDLLDAKEKYIAHQCNCITKKAAHLAAYVFDKCPYADIYTGRTTPDKPGTIIIKGDGDSKRFVINMLGQYYPGSPKYPNSTLDGPAIREKYFYHCLLRVAKIKDLESIAFPYKIACGAAGGNWKKYFGNINNFAKYVSNQGTKVVLYCLNDDDFKNAELEYKTL